MREILLEGRLPVVNNRHGQKALITKYSLIPGVYD
jgi:hypothetical protein